MKIVLNNSILEIASKNVENRNKVVYNASPRIAGTWAVSLLYSGFFIDIKQGDNIHIEGNDSLDTATVTVCFCSTNAQPVNGAAIPFANNTSAIIQGETLNLSAVENCYMYVMTKYQSHIRAPKTIEINEMTLNEDGYLV